jgi:nucleoside phosphorylase
MVNDDNDMMMMMVMMAMTTCRLTQSYTYSVIIMIKTCPGPIGSMD